MGFMSSIYAFNMIRHYHGMVKDRPVSADLYRDILICNNSFVALTGKMAGQTPEELRCDCPWSGFSHMCNHSTMPDYV